MASGAGTFPGGWKPLPESTLSLKRSENDFRQRDKEGNNSRQISFLLSHASRSFACKEEQKAKLTMTHFTLLTHHKHTHTHIHTYILKRGVHSLALVDVDTMHDVTLDGTKLTFILGN